MEDDEEEVHIPSSKAITIDQKESLAELSKLRKYRFYEDITVDDRSNYFKISCRPITKAAEDDMELISDIVTWGEMYLSNWEVGVYKCARCSRELYRSYDKWSGPCVWPSFRRPVSPEAISTNRVFPYNNYKVCVKEVYCGGCDLFLGHQFEDGKEKGDNHPDARWRY